MRRVSTFALQPVRNEMRGVSNLCGEAVRLGYNLLSFLLSSSYVVSHPRQTRLTGSRGIFVPYPASQAPLSPSTTPQPPHPTPPHPTPPHLISPSSPPRSLRLPLPIPVPQALLQRRAPYAQLMQLLARVPRSRPRPPLPLPIRPTLRAAIRPTRGRTSKRTSREPGLPRMNERRDPIERVARADAREAAQHDVVLVRERVERVERVQLRCVYG